MKKSEAATTLYAIFFAAQKARSTTLSHYQNVADIAVLEETLAHQHDALGQRNKHDFYLFGKGSIIIGLTKVLTRYEARGELDPGDYMNLLQLAWWIGSIDGIMTAHGAALPPMESAFAVQGGWAAETGPVPLYPPIDTSWLDDDALDLTGALALPQR